MGGSHLLLYIHAVRDGERGEASAELLETLHKGNSMPGWQEL